MKVETFEVTEIGVEGPIDNFEDCKALTEKLELKGQSKFFNSEKAEIVPYRKMTSQEALVYGKLLAKQTPLKTYEDGLIPLRVLQIASHALEIGICDEIEVWHAPNADIKDPVLVGKKKSGKNSWEYERYMLARWGEVLLPFSELCTMAREVIVSELALKISQGKAKYEQAERTIQEYASRAILTGRLPSIDTYISD